MSTLTTKSPISQFDRPHSAPNLLAGGVLPHRGHGSLASIVHEMLPPPRPAPEPASPEAKLHAKHLRAYKDAHDRMVMLPRERALAVAKALVEDLTTGKLRAKIPHEKRDATDPGHLLTRAIGTLRDSVNDIDGPATERDIIHLRHLHEWLTGYCDAQPLNGDIRRETVHGLRAVVARLVEAYA